MVVGGYFCRRFFIPDRRINISRFSRSELMELVRQKEERSKTYCARVEVNQHAKASHEVKRQLGDIVGIMSLAEKKSHFAKLSKLADL